MKLGVSEQASHNESEPSIKPRYKRLCGHGVRLSETRSCPAKNGARTGGTQRGQGGWRVAKVLSGTWENRRATPAGVGGGRSSDEASNDRGAKGLCMRRAESEARWTG